LQVLFESIDNIGEPVLIYQDGDDLDAALSRVETIKPDPNAGRADRDPIHPVLEPVADALSRPSLIVLGELINHGHINVSVVDVQDVALGDIEDSEFREFLVDAWAESSPRARAARAGGAFLLGRGLELSQLEILERHPGRTADGLTWAVEAREGKLRNFAWDLGHGFDGWLYVIRPERKQPLRALEIAATATSVLHREDCELDAWLLEHAPHIQQIGPTGG
jgi:hypothetical protein